MRNNIIVNKDTLRYSYDVQGRVTTVAYINGAGVLYTKVFFTYDGYKLVQMERDQKSATGFTIDKTMSFSYYADGNLKDLVYHYLPFNGSPDQTFMDHFEQYDNKINTDGFSLIHNDFFDHFVFLPGVQLQKNNPGKETRTGDGLTYTSAYTYTYNTMNLPLTKSGELTITSGAQQGQIFHISSIYSYYQ